MNFIITDKGTLTESICHIVENLSNFDCSLTTWNEMYRTLALINHKLAFLLTDTIKDKLTVINSSRNNLKQFFIIGKHLSESATKS